MNVLILGAGSLAKMVAEVVLQDSKKQLIGFADDQIPVGTKILDRFQVVSSIQGFDLVSVKPDGFLVAVGSVGVRKRLFVDFANLITPIAVVHEKAFVSSGASVGLGSVVLAGAVLNWGAIVGENCLINSNVLVDHDSVVGSHVNVGQGCVIGSNCVISEGLVLPIGQVFPSFSKVLI